MNPDKRKYDAVRLMGFGKPQKLPVGVVQTDKVVVRLAGQSMTQVIDVLRSWDYRVSFVDRLESAQMNVESRRGTWIIRPSIIGSENQPLDVQRERYLRVSESVTHPALLLAAIACHHRCKSSNLIGEQFLVHTEQADGLLPQKLHLLVQFIAGSREFVIAKRTDESPINHIRISGAARIMR